MEKNQECIIKIEDMSLEGEGVGRLDGYALFVKDTVIGDEVRVKIIKANKTYGYARLMEVITPSPYRVTARCPIARQCGGCNLQELSYDEQLDFKRTVIEKNIRRIGGLTDVNVQPVIGMTSRSSTEIRHSSLWERTRTEILESVSTQDVPIP